MSFSIDTAPGLAEQASRGDLNALLRLFLDIIYWIYPRPWVPVVSLADRKPEAGEILFDIILTFATDFPVNMEGSDGGCRVSPTTAAEFTLYKNFEAFGIATIDTNGVASFVGGYIKFAIGDVFSFVAPAVQDASLEGFYFSFQGRRT